MCLDWHLPENEKKTFDFKLNDLIENETKEKVALTEDQEQALLSFIKMDDVFHVLWWSTDTVKVRTSISALFGLTVADIDFKNEAMIIDHQLKKYR